MEITESQVHILKAIYSFSSIAVYQGMMPMRLVCSLCPDDVQSLLLSGYTREVARKGSTAMPDGLELTEKGMEALTRCQAGDALSIG